MEENRFKLNFSGNKINELLEKVNNLEECSKDYNELINKPEIPSLEGLATEEFVMDKIAESKLNTDNGEIVIPEEIISHITDEQLHASYSDRMYWNSKFDMPMSGINESHLSLSLQDKLQNIFSIYDIIDPDTGNIRETLLEEYVQQKIDDALANFNPRKLFDIIAATELPEVGRENQICVITDNPVDKFRISDNLDDNTLSEDEIFIYLDRRWRPQAKSILLKNDNIENHINIVDCRQGNIKKLDSYIYQNNQWNKLTDKSIVILYKDYFNEELFGSFPDKGIKDWILDENGIFFSESATGPDCTPKVALFFKNKIDFSLFNKVRITLQLDKASSYRLIIGSGTHSKYVGPAANSSSLEWSCYGNNNSSTYANIPFKNVAYSVVKHNTKDEVRTHEIDISTLNDFDYIGIALSSHGGHGYSLTDMRIIEIELL